MNTELISIICTVKNAEQTIAKTIESVINQSYKNWELIIVDDGSTDGTIEILKKYELTDERIVVIETEGIDRGRALNKAIQNTNGKYICNIDADDLIHPLKLEIQYNCMKEHPEYFLLSTESQIIYENETPEWSEINVNSKEFKIEKINNSIFFDNPIGHSSIMMKKDNLLQIGCYNEDRKSQLDYELWLRAYCNNLKLGKINEKLTAKRIHKNQSYENKKRLLYIYRNAKLKINYILKNDQKKRYILLAIILFILGLLPFKVRSIIRNLFTKLNLIHIFK